MSLSIKDGTGAAQTLRATLDGSDLVTHQSRKAQPAATGNTNNPSTNTAAVITKAAAGAGICNVLAAAYWSYGAAPTGGNLQITDNGNLVFEIDITAAGPGFMQFDPPLRGTANSALVATLAAGGSAVQGRVNLHAWTE